jgi:hypothetical protein
MRITITVQTEDSSGCARSGEIKREDTQEKWFADAYLLPAFRAALAKLTGQLQTKQLLRHTGTSNHSLVRAAEQVTLGGFKSGINFRRVLVGFLEHQMHHAEVLTISN